MEVLVATAADVSISPDFSVGEEVPVFHWDRIRSDAVQTMDATHDGKRITVDLNWFDEIEQRTRGADGR